MFIYDNLTVANIIQKKCGSFVKDGQTIFDFDVFYVLYWHDKIDLCTYAIDFNTIR